MVGCSVDAWCHSPRKFLVFLFLSILATFYIHFSDPISNNSSTYENGLPIQLPKLQIILNNSPFPYLFSQRSSYASSLLISFEQVSAILLGVSLLSSAVLAKRIVGFLVFKIRSVFRVHEELLARKPIAAVGQLRIAFKGYVWDKVRNAPVPVRLAVNHDIHPTVERLTVIVE